MKSKRSQTKHVVKFRHRFFYGLARILLAWIFRLHANFHSKHYHLKGKGPYIIVANHTSALDPILLAASTDIPIYYVASEIIFGHGLISRLLEFCFAPIPKSKSLPDISTIMTIKKVLKEKGTVGIFVEGNVTFTGGLASMPFAIGKLVKSLNVPLLFFRFHGVSQSDPRWATKRRKGRSWGEFYSQMNPDEYNALSLDELNKVIYERIDANPYQENPPLAFKTKHMSEHLERLVFACPHCHSVNTVHGYDDFVCDQCGFTAHYDEHGYLVSKEYGKQTLIEVDKLVKNNYQHYLSSHPDFELKGEGLWVEILKRRRKYHGSVQIIVNHESISIISKRKDQSFKIGYHELISMAVQQKGGLILYIHGRNTTMIKLPPSVSAYQFLVTLQIFVHRYKYIKGEVKNEFINLNDEHHTECLGL